MNACKTISALEYGYHRFAARRSSQAQIHSSANAFNFGLLLASFVYIRIWNIIVIIGVHELHLNMNLEYFNSFPSHNFRWAKKNSRNQLPKS